MNVKCIVFQIDGEEYAIPVQFVKSIEKIHNITRVPNTFSFIKGVINLRGVITPIVDLKERLQLGISEIGARSRMIVVTLRDFEIGLIVDGANDVLDLNQEEIEPHPETIDSAENDLIQGVINFNNRFIVLLDLEKVLEK